MFMPLGWASHRFGWSPTSVFCLNFLAMIPLAAILGDFTEEVAAHTNQVVGGLINATFGNAVEVVVAVQALHANEIRVVQASMIGSIFSNLLLVLGGCFFFGGLKYKEQSFNSTAVTANMSLLALSSVALALPTPFAEYYEVHDDNVLVISRIAAVFLIFMYLQLLVFQLHTHADLFDDDDDTPTEMSSTAALTGLVVVTLVIAQLSDYLVGSIDGFCTESGVSRTFVGLIVLPIVGNAVEHVTAISVAMKDKMDLAMGVAVGSCTQISLFATPVTVLIGWATGRDMTLNFPHFEIVLFVLSVIIVSICVSNPKTNWLEGSLLMTTYVMIAVGFWFERVQEFD
uniref:Sodium/calcium exchanger membrane region domain-containing protein n=1 Tax=Trieres chinensis TaxID=1514140 RepID=A0A7S1ZP93_TRICV